MLFLRCSRYKHFVGTSKKLKLQQYQHPVTQNKMIVSDDIWKIIFAGAGFQKQMLTFRRLQSYFLCVCSKDVITLHCIFIFCKFSVCLLKFSFFSIYHYLLLALQVFLVGKIKMTVIQTALYFLISTVSHPGQPLSLFITFTVDWIIFLSPFFVLLGVISIC